MGLTVLGALEGARRRHAFVDEVDHLEPRRQAVVVQLDARHVV